MTIQNQKQLPKGWKWVRLGDVAEIIMGQSPPSSTYNQNRVGLPFYQGVIDFRERYVTPRVYCSMPRKVLNPGDILLSVRAPVGKINITKEMCSIGRGNAGIRTVEGIQLYMFYFLKNYGKQLQKISSGSVFSSITKANIENLQIPLPPLPEQKAIADVLSSLDDKIELLQEQNKTLEEMAQTLFRKWFIDNPERKRWEKVRLGDGTLATIIKSGIEPFTGYKTYLATRDVQGLEIVGGTPIMYNSRPSRANMQPSIYSVWFAKKWGVQKLLMFDEFSNNVDNYILSTGFLGLKTRPETHYYIWLFVITDEFQEIKDTLVSGSVQPDITNAGVMKILIDAPPMELLESFNHKVKRMFAKISANERQIEVLRDLRDLLLPKLISGEVRVKI